MNRPEPGIPDVQSHADARALAIDRVGIRDLRYPIRFADGAEGDAAAQSTIATFGVYAALSADRKGTHISRMVAAIDEMREPLSLARLPSLLGALLQRLDSDAVSIDIEFPWFMRKAAPVSGGRCCNSRMKASRPPAEAPMPTIGKPCETVSPRAMAGSVEGPMCPLCPPNKKWRLEFVNIIYFHLITNGM